MLSIMTYVLDDDQDELMLLEPYLKRACGVDFEMYTDIEKFISAIQMGVHIGIIDHKLDSSVDGIEVGCEVLKKNPLTYLILYSGNSDKRVWQRATNCGFRGLVDKNDKDCFVQIENMIVQQKPAIEHRMQVYNQLESFNNKYKQYL